VTQTIGKVPGDGTGGGSDFCQLPILGWLCGKTWGVSNWILLLLGFIGLIILLGVVAAARKTSGKQSDRVIIVKG
jgi:hypothetical protein